ncbi:glycosyltransferase [Shimia litoralis]|uniref:Glycosyltransferase n=1 Tax=Shimia litoralis TaxID=420403 RepID=A0A4U7N5K0_9RHOB|nr:glycosyltransferase [Shimia litoralis]TKZ21119.1 glycosyltransferase [Shimia litoralis]
MNVLIVVTHLLGTGHLSRALTLGRAFAQAGHTVSVLSGGMPAPHMDQTGVTVLQMPPLCSDGTNFTTLLDDAGNVADHAYLSRRKLAGVQALHDVAPDVLITELFPFGRRSLSAEFTAILDAAQALPNRPVVLCSVRDILAPPSKPSKAEKAREILLRYFDGVLVHSDPMITQLAKSWPIDDDLSELLKYTGYVAPAAAAPHPDGVGQGEVLVSAGGGSVGQSLFEAAIDAAKQSELPWRLLVGGKDASERIAALRQRAGSLDITIEPVRPDFRQMLAGAAASVSMCGYNTALDLLQSGVPAVLVPFDDGGEVEQTLRSQSLAEQSAMSVVMAQDLTAHSLLRSLNEVVAQGPRHNLNVDFDGAVQTVRIAQDMCEDRA